MNRLPKTLTASALVALGLLATPVMADTGKGVNQSAMQALNGMINYEVQHSQYQMKQTLTADLLAASLYFEPEQKEERVKTRTSIQDLAPDEVKENGEEE